MGLKNVLIAHNKILTNLNLTAMGFGVDCFFLRRGGRFYETFGLILMAKKNISHFAIAINAPQNRNYSKTLAYKQQKAKL